MKRSDYKPRSFTLRKPGGRLELWLLGVAIVLVAVPGGLLFLLYGLWSLTNNNFIEAVVKSLSLAWVVCWAMAGGLIVASLFVFVRRKLGGS